VVEGGAQWSAPVAAAASDADLSFAKYL